MSFESGSVSFRMYSLAREIPEPVLEGFLQRVAPSLEAIKEEPVYGWVTGRHLLDRQIDENSAFLGGYLRLCLLEAQRKIPTSLLRAELKQEELIRLTVHDHDHLSRKERTEMKQEIVERLLPAMPPQLKGATFVHRRGDEWVYAETLAEKQVDTFTSYLREAIGFPPQVLTPESLALSAGRTDSRDWPPCSFSKDVEAQRTSDQPGHDFMTWLWYQSETHPDRVPAGQAGTIGVLVEGPLTLVMEGGGAHEISLRKGNPTKSAEAKACLLAGKKLRRATVHLVRGEQVWKLTLDGETLAVRGLKPIVPENALDMVSQFQDRVRQVELVGELIRGLYTSFVEERKSRDLWGKRVQEMQTWITERTVAY